VWVAGRERNAEGANMVIGGFIIFGDGYPSDQPAADIRSCHQWTHRSSVPEGYTGERDGSGDALLGGSLVFMADEIEVLHVVGQ